MPLNDSSHTLSEHGSTSRPRNPAASVSEPIDPQALAELRSHFEARNSPLFNDLLALFIGELTPRLGAIRAAIDHTDAKAIAAAAHVLKGSSLLVGAHVMAELCLQIELAARSDAIAQAQALLTLLEDEAPRVRHALAAISGTGPRG
jgi:HPt (histidine-containing phosphotransfer) domain-containing protein